MGIGIKSHLTQHIGPASSHFSDCIFCFSAFVFSVEKSPKKLTDLVFISRPTQNTSQSSDLFLFRERECLHHAAISRLCSVCWVLPQTHGRSAHSGVEKAWVSVRKTATTVEMRKSSMLCCYLTPPKIANSRGVAATICIRCYIWLSARSFLSAAVLSPCPRSIEEL